MSAHAPGAGVAEDLLEIPFDILLDEIATAARSPASGSVAALVVAMAAELVAAAARRSGDEWKHAGGAVAQAHALRLRSAPLALTDAKAYERAAELLRSGPATRPGERDHLLGRALERSAEIPLVIAGVAADVAALAREVAEKGGAGARGDAAAAATLAHGAASAAAHLVAINLGATSDDLRVASARSLAAAAGAWADAAVSFER